MIPCSRLGTSDSVYYDTSYSLFVDGHNDRIHLHGYLDQHSDTYSMQTTL